MKNVLFVLVVMTTLVTGLVSVRADDLNQAFLTALQRDREYNDERFKRLESQLEALTDSNAMLVKNDSELRKRMENLMDENQRLREELSRELAKRPANALTAEDIKPLENKMRELSQARESDKKLILDKLEQIANKPPVVIQAPRRSETTTEKKAEKKTDKTQEGFEYIVKSGDNLSLIIDAYRKEGVKVTRDQVIKANPKMNPNKLKAGQKIAIPDLSTK